MIDVDAAREYLSHTVDEVEITNEETLAAAAAVLLSQKAAP